MPGYEPTIELAVPMISAALRQIVTYGFNERAAFAIESMVQNPADEEIIETCRQYMTEIYDTKQTSLGTWRWTHTNNDPNPYSLRTKLICEIVGCWYRDDYFYTNQNHKDWR